MSHQIATNDQLDAYLKLPMRKDRVTLLRKWIVDGRYIPLFFCQDMLTLNLSTDEHIALIDACESDQKLAFEFWLFDKIQQWNQDVAGAGLRVWATKTDCLLWHRLLPILRIPGLPQRIRYAILEFAPRCAGPEIVSIIIESEGWEDFSPAFHALLFDRAIQFVSKWLLF